MENIKKLSKKSIIFFFSHKKFLKLFSKPMPLGHQLIFPLNKKKKKNYKLDYLIEFKFDKNGVKNSCFIPSNKRLSHQTFYLKLNTIYNT